MNTYAKFYTESLYPIQDGVLLVVKNSGTPFYLTGGTALSRHYLNHRYSDDLDLFVNNDPHFQDYVSLIIGSLNKKHEEYNWMLLENTFIKARDYVQINIKYKFDSSPVLKIDMVNDTAEHAGGFEMNPDLGNVDGWRNILSNKLSAVFRFEVKDYIDIWAISKSFSFKWEDIIADARKKEAGLDPSLICEAIKGLPVSYYSRIKWIQEVNYDLVKNDLEKIALDILGGYENSIFKNNISR
jgi:hypothetical protein